MKTPNQGNPPEFDLHEDARRSTRELKRGKAVRLVKYYLPHIVIAVCAIFLFGALAICLWQLKVLPE